MANQTENKFRSLLSRLQHAERLFVNASAYLLEVRQDIAELLKEFPEADCGSRSSENDPQTTLRRTNESQISLFLKPEKPCSISIVDISQEGLVLAVVYPEKREGFQVVMHSLGYRWHRDKGRYEFVLGNEPALDRLAEVANRLVARGFIVCLHNEEAQRWFPFSDSLAASLRWACVIVKPPRQVPALRHSRAEEVANMPHPGYGCPARNEDVCCCSNQSNVSTLA